MASRNPEQTRRTESRSNLETPQATISRRVSMKKLLFLLSVMLITVGMSVAQSNSSSTNPDQSSSSATGQSSSNPDQNATSNPSSTPSSDQSATSTDQTSTTKTTTHKHRASGAASDQNAGASAGGNLPQTASPLPLLGLLGLGSLAAGVVTRRKNR
jgi:LPXTG-motif cell wall-anchored protein